MAKVEIHVRFKGEYVKLKEDLDKYCDEKGLSLNDCILELLSRALTGQLYPVGVKNIKGGKIIVSKYKTKCSRCGRELSPGELVYWVSYEYEDGSRNSITLCLDCYYSINDKTIASNVLRRFKLRREIQALEKYEKEIAKHVEDLEKKLKQLNPIRDYYELRGKFNSVFFYLEKLMNVRNDIQEYNTLKDTIFKELETLKELGEKIRREVLRRL